MLRFADCLPVLLYDPVRRAIGLAHAGWRGTLKGIAAKTALTMVEAYGSRPADIVAGLGPCIGPCCYQVGTEVIELVKAGFSHWRELLHSQGDGSVHFDLWEANRRQLDELRMPPSCSAPAPQLPDMSDGCGCSEQTGGQREGSVEVSRLCTVCQNDEFFSHRAEQGRTGRFAVILGMRG
jgi:copper oxidase (laccase) domain-containing protein